MKLGAVTELGASSSSYEIVLSDLRARAAQRESTGYSSRTCYVATLGEVDLMALSLFDHHLFLADAVGSSAQSFRRAIGVLAPEAAELDGTFGEGRAAEVVDADTFLEGAPASPLLACLYAKLSPVLGLAVREPGHVDRVLGRIFAKEAPLWHRYREVLEASDASEPPPSESLSIAPLIGLDAVELVVWVRCATLEQLAALNLALRNERLGTAYAASEVDRAVLSMLGRGTGDRDGGERAWAEGALFLETTPLVGLPIETPGDDGPGHDAASKVADKASLWVRHRYMPGHFRRALEFTSAGKDLLRSQDGVPTALGPADLVVAKLLGGGASFEGPLTRGHLDEHLREMRQGPPSGGSAHVITSTEVTVRMRVPGLAEASPGIEPDSTLAIGLAGWLADLRRDYTARREPAPPEGAAPARRSWLQRWIDATQRAGTLYPTTNAMVSLIQSVLDYLPGDLEGFLDLLPGIEATVDVAEAFASLFARVELETGLGDDARRDIRWNSAPAWREQVVNTEQLGWMYERVESLAASRGRRDHPLRHPQTSLAFEWISGYRLPRDAFLAFAHAVQRRLYPHGEAPPLLVLDAAGGGLSVEAGPAGVMAVRVSTVALNHPLHWAFAHEAGHARLAGAMRVDLAASAPATVHAGHELMVAAGCPPHLGGAGPWSSVSGLLDAVAERLRSVARAQRTELAVFLQAVASNLEEVPAELLLHRSLALDDGPDGTDARFWFVVGPTLALGLQHRHGHAPVGKTELASLALRLFLVDHLARAGAAEDAADTGDALEEYLDDVVRTLQGGHGPSLPATGRYERLIRDRETAPQAAVQAVSWLRTGFLMASSAALPGLPDGVALVDATLALARALGQPHAPLAWESPAPIATPTCDPAERFARYVDDLRRWWPGIGGAEWPPIVRGHVHGGTLALSCRGGVFGPSDLQREYLSRSYALMRELDDAARVLRGGWLIDRFERLPSAGRSVYQDVAASARDMSASRSTRARS